MSLKVCSRVWLLVEWVDEGNVFPSYEVVNVDTRAYNETDLQPGNVIFLSVKHENPRRAKILRLSDNKRFVNEQKDILERQDQQVKNVLQLCMRTIKEMKTEHFNSSQHSASHNTLAHVVVAKGASDSDSDAEPSAVLVDKSRSCNVNKYTKIANTQHNRTPQSTYRAHSLNSNNQRRRSMVSSTPLPGNPAPETIRLCFDQGTQTDALHFQPSIAKVEEMEAVLKNLYRRFNALVAQVNHSNGSTSMSESEYNDVSYIEPNNEQWDEEHNGYMGQHNQTEHVDGNGDGQVVVENDGEPMNLVNLHIKVEERPPTNSLRVRRMSAQTTNNIEASPQIDADLVPIGNGNAKVPARLLNDIDWTSHTNATRQLLQAIFPRKVLATHSLTGKQSPAFLNKPAKKILDPKVVEDIVKTVSNRCAVPKNLVRNCITIKCTDEAKLYRNRLQYKHARKSSHQNEENVPPSIASSDELSNVIN